MRKITITAGIDQDRDSKPIQNLEQELQSIRQELALRFGGFTELHGVGGWVTHNSELVQERCIQWVIYTGKPFIDGLVNDTAEMIRSSLNQYSVMLENEKAHYVEVAGHG